MKNLRLILLPLLAALLFTACASTANQIVKQSSNQSFSLDKDQVWQLVKMQGRNLPRDAKTVTLSFNPEAGSFRGSTACNFYAGTYSLGTAAPDDPRLPLDIELVGSGSILCPEADMNAEGRFLAALQKANYILLNENTLTLYHGDREILLFELR